MDLFLLCASSHSRLFKRFIVARLSKESHFHHFVFPCWFLFRWKTRWSIEYTAITFSLSISWQGNSRAQNIRFSDLGVVSAILFVLRKIARGKKEKDEMEGKSRIVDKIRKSSFHLAFTIIRKNHLDGGTTYLTDRTPNVIVIGVSKNKGSLLIG